MNRSIGIIAHSNDVGGLNKLIAMIANDLSDQDTDVYIYVPIFPFYTYYVTFFKKPFFWLLKIVPNYFLTWLSKKASPLNDLLDKKKNIKSKN